MPDVASQPNFGQDELVLMLDYVVGREEGVSEPVSDLSDRLRALPANAVLARDPTFRRGHALGSSLGHMKAINAGGGDWPAGHQYSGRPSVRPHFKAVWGQFGRDGAARGARRAAILGDPAAAGEVEEPDLDQGFVEGRTYYALHRRVDRRGGATAGPARTRASSGRKSRIESPWPVLRCSAFSRGGTLQRRPCDGFVMVLTARYGRFFGIGGHVACWSSAVQGVSLEAGTPS